MKKTDTVCYSKGAKTIIDMMVEVDGQHVGLHSGQGIDEMKARYPDAEYANLDDAHRVIEAEYITQPQEIDEESYRGYLEALPPVGMNTVGNTQSFKMSERRFGQVTLICAKVGRCYFKFHDRITLTHSQVMEKVQAHLISMQEASRS